MKFVLDCSVAASWCFEDETTSYTEKVLTTLNKNYQARVPSLWPFEMSNVLLLAERKKRVGLLTISTFKNTLSILPIEVDHGATDRALDTIFELGREMQLTAYDAAYLELAFREKIPLASLDKTLVRAAREINIAIF